MRLPISVLSAVPGEVYYGSRPLLELYQCHSYSAINHSSFHVLYMLMMFVWSVRTSYEFSLLLDHINSLHHHWCYVWSLPVKVFKNAPSHAHLSLQSTNFGTNYQINDSRNCLVQPILQYVPRPCIMCPVLVKSYLTYWSQFCHSGLIRKHALSP